jgi:hypothetical protein
MTKFLGIFFLAAWVSGQIFRRPGEFPVTLLDVAVGGMIITKIREIREIGVIRGMSLILIASWILGLRIFSWQQSIPGGLYLIRFLGYLWVIANAGKLFLPVKKIIIPAFWIFIILAWVQYLFLPDTRFLLQYGWDEHYYRMIGTVLDPNYLGVMLGVIGIYLIYKYTNRQIDKWGKILLALTFGGLIMTYSRAAWLAMTVGLSVYLVIPAKAGIYKNNLNRFRIKFGMTMKILMGLLIFGLVLYLSPRPGGEGVNLFRTNSIEQRIESWKEGISVWRDHPWVGVGFNNYRVAKEKVQEGKGHGENAPSSSWILLLATTGIVGMGGLGAIWGIWGIREITNSKLWIGILMMIGVHAIFNNTLFYPPVLGLLALIKVASEE